MPDVFIPPWIAQPADPATHMRAGLGAGIAIGTEQARQVDEARNADLRAQALSAQMDEAQARLEQSKAVAEMEHEAKVTALQQSMLYHQQQLEVDKAYKQNLATFHQGQLQNAQTKLAADEYRRRQEASFVPTEQEAGGMKMIQNAPGRWVKGVPVEESRLKSEGGVQWIQGPTGAVVQVRKPPEARSGTISPVDKEDLAMLKLREAALYKSLTPPPSPANAFDSKGRPLTGQAKETFDRLRQPLLDIQSERSQIMARYRPPAAGTNTITAAPVLPPPPMTNTVTASPPPRPPASTNVVTVLNLPATKKELVDGAKYRTREGVLTWDGKHFVD